MKCIDYFKREKRFKNLIEKRIPKTTIVDCSSVSEYLFQFSSKDEWSMEDFDVLAPPFDECWLDFKAPEYVSLPGVYEKWKKTSPSHWAFDCVWTEATEENIMLSYMKMPNIWSDHVKRMLEWTKGSKWYLDILLFWVMEGEPDGPIWMWRLFLNEDGSCGVFTKENDRFNKIIEGPVHGGYIKTIERISIEQKVSEDEARNILYSIISPYLHSALLSIVFIHCKNVILEDTVPDKKKHLTNAQKRRGEEKTSIEKHKVLVLEPMKKIIKKTSEESGVGTKKAYHICKGHFVTYSKEKPLFGRPDLYGKFFVPMHARGSLNQGIVTKDYQINVKKENLNES